MKDDAKHGDGEAKNVLISLSSENSSIKNRLQ